MKTKLFLLSGFMIIYSAHAFAQFSYAGINIGYGFGVPPYSLGSSTQTSPNGTTYALEKGSYGQGLNFGINAGFMFNKNIGAELGISYLVGSKKEFNTSSLDVDSSSATVTEGEGTTTLNEIKMFRLNPAVKITFGEDVRPYLRMGIILGLGTGYTRTEESTVTTIGSTINDTTTIERVTEYSGGSSIGFNSAFGIEVTLTDNLSFFSELSFTSLSWAPTKSTITKLTLDGADLTTSAPPGSLDAQYVDDYTQPFAGNSGAVKSLKSYLPFGSFGINAGVVFTFGE